MEGPQTVDQALEQAAKLLLDHSMILKGMAQRLAALSQRLETLEGRVERMWHGGRF